MSITTQAAVAGECVRDPGNKGLEMEAAVSPGKDNEILKSRGAER